EAGHAQKRFLDRCAHSVPRRDGPARHVRQDSRDVLSTKTGTEPVLMGLAHQIDLEPLYTLLVNSRRAAQAHVFSAAARETPARLLRPPSSLARSRTRACEGVREGGDDGPN